jgi:Holliday junction resolvase RusA-like endonuclease
MRLPEETRIIRPEDGLPIPVLPELTPLVGFGLDKTVNINDALYMAPRPRAGMIKTARTHGYKIGLAAGRALGIPVVCKRVKVSKKSMRDFAIEMLEAPLTEYRIFTVLYLWHERSLSDPNKAHRKRDVYNPLVKATVDGLTDAGLWVDDNASYHTDFWVTYKGLADKGRAELVFYAHGLPHTIQRSLI